MDSKICSSCKIDKPLDEFYIISKSNPKPYSKCKNCFNSYCVERWVKRKINAIKYKGSSCLDCGISFPEEPYVIFDFHHRDPSQKDVDWGKLKLRSQKSINTELDKCDLLCSNCHRKRHHMFPFLGSN